MKVGDIDRRTYECETVKDSMAKHQVWSILSKDFLSILVTSYFCMSYFQGVPITECVNKKHVHELTLTYLRPKNILKVHKMMYDLDEEFKVGIGGEWIIDNLSLSHYSSCN